MKRIMYLYLGPKSQIKRMTEAAYLEIKARNIWSLIFNEHNKIALTCLPDLDLQLFCSFAALEGLLTLQIILMSKSDVCSFIGCQPGLLL